MPLLYHTHAIHSNTQNQCLTRLAISLGIYYSVHVKKKSTHYANVITWQTPNIHSIELPPPVLTCSLSKTHLPSFFSTIGNYFFVIVQWINYAECLQIHDVYLLLVCLQVLCVSAAQSHTSQISNLKWCLWEPFRTRKWHKNNQHIGIINYQQIFHSSHNCLFVGFHLTNDWRLLSFDSMNVFFMARIAKKNHYIGWWMEMQMC